MKRLAAQSGMAVLIARTISIMRCAIAKTRS